MFNFRLTERHLLSLECLVAIVFCFSPLFFTNPYRLNIFLSWEGAYRLYLGQVPFRDFSLPMGYGHWVIPALFFHVFGPTMHTLIKAQVFINVLSIISFRGILQKVGVSPAIILLSVIVFCFSYVSINFWPWYNHLVIVLELFSIYLLLIGLSETKLWKVLTALGLSAFTIFFSFFTKQDGGALGLMILYAIIIYDAWLTKSWRSFGIFSGFVIFFFGIGILPLLPYDFLYWFNYGQAPHDSRLVLKDFLNHLVGWAYWEKFFLMILVLYFMDKVRTGYTFFTDRSGFLFWFITLAIILEAMVIQVTSDEPPYGEVFFYAFGFAFCISNIKWTVDFSQLKFLAVAGVLVVFWWTGIYWRNIQRLISDKPTIVKNMEKRKSKYRVAHEFKTLDHLYLSEETIAGMHRIKQMETFRNNPGVRVLNMSELTTLAHEVPFTPLTDQPMWFHQGVSIFQKEVDEFCERIEQDYYDVVFFQTIPENEVIDFFPSDVKDCLDQHYHLEFSFLAPRSPEESYVHVYSRRKK